MRFGMIASGQKLLDPQQLKQLVLAQASALGLAPVGIARLDAFHSNDTAARLQSFLSEGRHGDMHWMAETAERRGDPLRLWPEARSAILIGDSYAPQTDPLLDLQHRNAGVISAYARGRDYHDVLKSKIRKLAQTFATQSGADVKIFVDTAPLMEKPLAQRAGLGWQGKHTNLVSRAYGSDAVEADHCGSCSRCIDICPTQAFPAPYKLDARRCIAYLTIEYKGQIAREFRSAIGNRVFGCDDCLAVCPWNKFAQAAREVRYTGGEATVNPPLEELLTLDDAAFRKRFAGTPVKRTGRDRVVRNALIAAGNSGDCSLVPLIEPLLADASSLVRGMAIWAVQQLASAEEVAKLRATHSASERDDAVSAEWRQTQQAV
jgi:epoxyqueuosine reductase